MGRNSNIDRNKLRFLSLAASVREVRCEAGWVYGRVMRLVPAEWAWMPKPTFLDALDYDVNVVGYPDRRDSRDQDDDSSHGWDIGPDPIRWTD